MFRTLCLLSILFLLCGPVLAQDVGPPTPEKTLKTEEDQDEAVGPPTPGEKEPPAPTMPPPTKPTGPKPDEPDNDDEYEEYDETAPPVPVLGSEQKDIPTDLDKPKVLIEPPKRPSPWLIFGEEGNVILSPKGFWITEMVGDIRAGRDGQKGTKLDYQSLGDGMGLDTELLTSPYINFQFPGKIFGQPFMAEIAFWWLNYDGAAQPNPATVGLNFQFNRTTMPADGRVYRTELTIAAINLRFQVQGYDFEEDGLPGLTLHPILLWTFYRHDMEIRDPFTVGAKFEDRAFVEGVWPTLGLRFEWEPDWWVNVFTEVLWIDFSWTDAFEMQISQTDFKGGVLFKFDESWGLMGDYTYSYVHLERGKRRDGKAELDVTISGPAISIYAEF